MFRGSFRLSLACRMVIIALLASLIVRMTSSTAFHITFVAPCSLIAALFVYSGVHKL